MSEPADPTTPPARSFGAVAEAYQRGRPSYPREAAIWLTRAEPTTVLELGAGTGKLTEQLVALGHDVHATDPDAAMLDILGSRLPDVRISLGSAEEIDAPDASYDVVVVAQAFHWFATEATLAAIQRVLKPGGQLSLVWNTRDERIPWVKRLGRLIGTQEQLRDPSELIGESLQFIMLERQEFRHRQVIDRKSILDLVLSRSHIAALPHDEREAKCDEVLAFYDDYGRGMDGMQLPYLSQCYRTRVVKRREPQPMTEPPPATTQTSGSLPAAAQTIYDPDSTQEIRLDGTSTGSSTGPPTDDDGVLLIDFK